MPTSTRIKGRNLVLTLDGDDYAVDASSITLTNEDKDGEVRTFADITPPKQWFLKLKESKALMEHHCGISYGITMVQKILRSCSSHTATQPHLHPNHTSLEQWM